MIELSKALDFNGYLNKNSAEEREKLVNNLKNIKLSEEAKDEIQAIKERVNVVVFSEGYCPDCVATLPFLERMQQENNNIKVFYYGMKGNEQILEEYTGTARIPTVMTFTENMEPKGAYIEVPAELSEKMGKLPQEKQREIISEYRNGKYNSLIEKELTAILR